MTGIARESVATAILHSFCQRRQTSLFNHFCTSPIPPLGFFILPSLFLPTHHCLSFWLGKPPEKRHPNAWRRHVGQIQYEAPETGTRSRDPQSWNLHIATGCSPHLRLQMRSRRRRQLLCGGDYGPRSRTSVLLRWSLPSRATPFWAIMALVQTRCKNAAGQGSR